MTLQTAFELGQLANRIKEHGADSIYEDFMKIIEKLMNEPSTVINQPSNWTIWSETIKPNPNDPLNPLDVKCSDKEPVLLKYNTVSAKP